MTLLQSTMQQPWCKDLMANLGFVFKPDGDLSAAAAGHPASSRPGGMEPKESKLETKPEVKTIEAKHEKPEIDPKAPKMETPPVAILTELPTRDWHVVCSPWGKRIVRTCRSCGMGQERTDFSATTKVI